MAQVRVSTIQNSYPRWYLQDSVTSQMILSGLIVGRVTMSFYKKHFIPLESNPDVFNELINLLGVSPSLRFEDVLSLDGPYVFPRPVLALILVMPTTDGYERRNAVEDATYEESNSGQGEDIVWYKQTINNACGLYAILHALSNGVDLDVLGKFHS